VLGKAIDPFIAPRRVPLNELLLFEDADLAQETVAVGPAFVRIGKVAESGPQKHVGGPEEKV
jgi:hypothetical protein